MTQCIKSRNAIIAAATLRIPRRSQEIIERTLKEFDQAKNTVIEEKPFFIYVLKHKTNKSGEPAPIVVSKLEYEALSLYIKHIRPKFTSNENKVFPICPFTT